MRLLPETRWADKIVAFKKFVKRHKRLPSSRMTMNDEYYRIKTSDMIRDPLRVFVSDKEYVKLYVRAVVGEDYNVPTLGVIRSPEAIAGYDFPQDCCVKPTHASGAVLFRRDGSNLDHAVMKSWFKMNHYRNGREANYKYLQPKIIIEPILGVGEPLTDYRIFCYNGAAKMVQVDFGDPKDRSKAFYDVNWAKQPFSTNTPMSPVSVPRPNEWIEMLEVAKALSERFDSLIRVDMYSIDSMIAVGEITNVNGNAQGRFIPPEGEDQAIKLLFGG